MKLSAIVTGEPAKSEKVLPPALRVASLGNGEAATAGARVRTSGAGTAQRAAAGSTVLEASPEQTWSVAFSAATVKMPGAGEAVSKNAGSLLAHAGDEQPGATRTGSTPATQKTRTGSASVVPGSATHRTPSLQTDGGADSSAGLDSADEALAGAQGPASRTDHGVVVRQDAAKDDGSPAELIAGDQDSASGGEDAPVNVKASSLHGPDSTRKAEAGPSSPGSTTGTAKVGKENRKALLNAMSDEGSSTKLQMAAVSSPEGTVSPLPASTTSPIANTPPVQNVPAGTLGETGQAASQASLPGQPIPSLSSPMKTHLAGIAPQQSPAATDPAGAVVGSDSTVTGDATRTLGPAESAVLPQAGDSIEAAASTPVAHRGGTKDFVIGRQQLDASSNAAAGAVQQPSSSSATAVAPPSKPDRKEHVAAVPQTSSLPGTVDSDAKGVGDSKLHPTEHATAIAHGVTSSNEVHPEGAAAGAQLAAPAAAPSHAASAPKAAADAGLTGQAVSAEAVADSSSRAGAPVDAHTLDASPTVLEIGVPGGVHGWLKVRAELDAGGSVHASVSSQSAAVREAIRQDLPALADYVAAERPGSKVEFTVHEPARTNSVTTEVTYSEDRPAARQNWDATQSSNLMQGEFGGAGSKSGYTPAKDQGDGFSRIAAKDYGQDMAQGSSWPLTDYGDGMALQGGAWLNVLA